MLAPEHWLAYNDGCECPCCPTGRLRVREVRKDGPNKGKKFLGCDNVDCRYAEWPPVPVEPLPGHGDECLACGDGRMLTRALDDVQFLVCSRYPDCTRALVPAESEPALRAAGFDL